VDAVFDRLRTGFIRDVISPSMANEYPGIEVVLRGMFKESPWRRLSSSEVVQDIQIILDDAAQGVRRVRCHLEAHAPNVKAYEVAALINVVDKNLSTNLKKLVLNDDARMIEIVFSVFDGIDPSLEKLKKNLIIRFEDEIRGFTS
jgi:hypothetical protein